MPGGGVVPAHDAASARRVVGGGLSSIVLLTAITIGFTAN
jgi:hypothetical protein